MSNLIAIAYEDVGKARSVLDVLHELSVEHAITLDDAVIAERRPTARSSCTRRRSPPRSALRAARCGAG